LWRIEKTTRDIHAATEIRLAIHLGAGLRNSLCEIKGKLFDYFKQPTFDLGFHRPSGRFLRARPLHKAIAGDGSAFCHSPLSWVCPIQNL
jgi:hypothetical protein